jgi:hypothetical protein
LLLWATEVYKGCGGERNKFLYDAPFCRNGLEEGDTGNDVIVLVLSLGLIRALGTVNLEVSSLAKEVSFILQECISKAVGVRLPSKEHGNASRVIPALEARDIVWFLTKG